MGYRSALFEDFFEVKCKKCGSHKVVLNAENCHECGLLIKGECESCGSIYDYHKFEKIEENE